MSGSRVFRAGAASGAASAVGSAGVLALDWVGLGSAELGWCDLFGPLGGWVVLHISHFLQPGVSYPTGKLK